MFVSQKVKYSRAMSYMDAHFDDSEEEEERSYREQKMDPYSLHTSS